MKSHLKILIGVLLFGLVPLFSNAQEFSSIQKLISSGQEDAAIEQLKGLEDQNGNRFLNLMGEALLRKGRYEEALENFQKAEYLQEQNPSADKKQLANTYSFIALVHWTTGNDQLSLQYHFKALDLRTQQSDIAAVAASTNDIGLVYSRSNPEKALAYYKKALADYEKLYGNNDEKTATAYINIGIAYNNLEYHEDALENLERALSILQQTGRGSAQEAFVHSSIGNVYSKKNNLDQSLQEYDIALGIYKKVYGEKHPEIASTYNSIGNTFYAQGEFLDALYNYQFALIANIKDFNSRELYDNPEISDYYNADVLLRSLYQKALAFEDLHNTFSLKIRDLDMAYSTIELCDSLIDKIRQFRSSESDKVALGNLASDIYQSAIRICLNMAEIKWDKLPYRSKAFYYSDKSKSAVLLEAIADANAKSFAGIPDDLLEQEKVFKAQVIYYEQKLAGKPTPEEEVVYRKELFDWTKNYNELISSLEELYPTYFNLKHNAKVPTVDEIQNKLSEDKAMISYFVATEDKLVYAFVITKKNLKIYEIPLEEDYEMNIS